MSSNASGPSPSSPRQRGRRLQDLDVIDAEQWLRQVRRLPQKLRQPQRRLPTPSPEAIHEVSLGTDQAAGNLLGIQPWITPAHLSNIGTYAAMWQRYLTRAQEAGWINTHTIVVLPEHVGTWMLFDRENGMAYESDAFDSALQWMALGRPIDTLTAVLQSTTPTGLHEQVFRHKAERMARQYQQLFSRLARTYAVTLVAGSIALPSPWLQEGKLRAGTGPFVSISLVFRPDGTCHSTMFAKAHPSRKERALLTAAPADPTPSLLDTPAGKLHVRLGTDAWFRSPQLPPDALLAAPAFALPHCPNQLLFPTPAGRAAVMVAARGQLWDTLPGGPILYTQPTFSPGWQEVERTPSSVLFNLWLQPPTQG